MSGFCAIYSKIYEKKLPFFGQAFNKLLKNYQSIPGGGGARLNDTPIAQGMSLGKKIGFAFGEEP